MNRFSHLTVYIDPSLKSYDKEFYARCEQEFLEFDFQIVSDIKDLKKTELPKILILFNEVLCTDQINYESDIIIQYKKPNLDLFGDTNASLKAFEVENINDFMALWHFFMDSLSINLKKLEQKLIEDRQKNLKKVFTKTNLNNFDDESDKVKILGFETQLYSENIQDLRKLSDLLVECFEEPKLEVLTIAEVQTRMLFDEVIPVRYINGHHLFLIDCLNKSQIVKIVFILESYFESLDLLSSSENIAANWNQMIDLINIPIVLLDEVGHPLIHNREFSKINYPIAECLKLENNQQLNIEDKIFRVIINNNLVKKTALIFFPVNEYLSQNNNPSSTDLGIISSSIAHELNNPLGGVLAAIDVLMLDDLDEEIQEHLVEMKNGVTRCKKLVETFLGFSRFKKSEMDISKLNFSLKESIQQAMELVRFRLVENNLTMDLQYKIQENLERNFNPHIFSMIFYLIFGEVITNFSHYNLVKGEKGQKIVLNLLENQRGLAVTFPDSIEQSKDFTQIKLVSHLLEGEGIRTKQIGKSLEFFF